MLMPDRRLLLAALSASWLAPAARAADAIGGKPGLRLGPPQDFSFDWLTTLAQKNASQPYKVPQSRAAQIIKAIDFDAVQKIRFRADHSLWLQGADPVAFFHLNKYSADPVSIHAVEGGKAREILYGPDYFDYKASGLDARALANLGFAGFRVMDAPGWPSRVRATSVRRDRMRNMAHPPAASPSTPGPRRRRNFPASAPSGSR
jgi:glucans biosynthesis protein